jgi:NADH-quinone oxidoreductase subunit C
VPPLSDTGSQGAVAEIPGDLLREGILDRFRALLGDGIVGSHLKPGDDLWIRVTPAAWRATGQAAKELGFDYFCFLSAIDWLPSPFGKGEDDPTAPAPERSTEIVQGYAGGETRFQVFARVVSSHQHVGVTFKVDVPEDALVIDSWVPVYIGSNWHERETHEMFGIAFAGHPDLRNIYLPGEFEGYPLRKDFPLLSRIVKPWPGIVDVEPMPGGDEEDES